MSFLAPLFLVALAGLALPVLFHLTRRERGKPLAFPSLMFLERIPFRERSRLRLRHLVLLLIRLAALALVVFAFARPFVRDGRLAAVGGAGPEEVVVLLDRSYSMGLDDHWDQGVSMAGSVVDALGPSDRVSLIAFDETPVLLHRSTTEPRRVAESLDTLAPTSLATRVAPAIKLAASVLEASELPRRRVAVVSDFQRAGWRPDRDAVLPEGTTVATLVVGDEATGAANLALTGLELRRESTGGRERVSASARVVAPGAGRQSARQDVGAQQDVGARQDGGAVPAQNISAEVALLVDETEVGRASVSVPPGGAAPVAFAPFTLTSPFTRGELRLSDDPLLADNALHFVASPGGDVAVAVVDPLGSGESNLYLRGALGIADGAGFATRVARRTPGADVLAASDVVVLNGAPFPGGDTGTRLREFVEGGGGLLVALGERSRVPSAHADFLPVAVGRPFDLAGGQLHLGFVDYDHAVFEAFRGARAGDFSRAAFFRVRALEVGDGRVLARFDDGSPALVEGRRGAGRVLVWATGLDRFWNDLPLHPVYLPFVHRVVRHLGAHGELPPWHPAGATVNLAELAESSGLQGLPEGAAAMEPGGGSVPLDPTTPLLALDVQGVWEIRPPGERPDHPIAVAANVDVAESDLSRLDVEEFAGAIGGGLGTRAETAAGAAVDEAGEGADEAGGPDNAREGAADAGEGAADAGERAADASGPDRSRSAGPPSADLEAEEFEKRQAFWRYLLAAAFLLMVSETILANRLSRFREAGPERTAHPQ